MKVKNKILAVFASLALALSFASCGSSNAKNSNGDGTTVIRVGYFSSAQYQVQLAIAKEKGFFDEAFEGLDVEIEYDYFAGAGPAINESFLAGELDVAHGIGDQPALSGILNDNQTVIISRIVSVDTGGGILVGYDSDIKSVGDLKGKTVAVGIGSAGQKILDLYLADYGLTEDDINMVNLTKVDELIAAFQGGDIDAALTSSYTYLENQVGDEKLTRQLVDLTEHPNYAYLTMTKSFIEEHTEIAEKFVEALYKANEWYYENVDEGNQIVADFLETDLENVQLGTSGCTVAIAFEDEDIKDIQETYDFLKANDILPSEVDDLSTIYDDSIINKIINKQ